MSALLERTRPAVSLDNLEHLAAGLVPHSFPSHDDVMSMRDRLKPRIGLHTGAPVGGTDQCFVVLSAGTVALRERTIHGMDLVPEVENPDELALPVGGGVKIEDYPAGFEHLDVDHRISGGKRSAISQWSRGSRRRMVRAIAELDLSQWADDGGNLAMVTLTLPGWWESIVPTGQDWKKLIDRLRKRWVRETETPWRGLWKLEFQRRGAPHQHMLMRVPALVQGRRFEDWLAKTWADLCLDALISFDERYALGYIELGEYDRHLAAGIAVDFSGSRFSDPRRTSIYFLKHSTKTTDSKEYQHIVPTLWSEDGPGRFWGVWGLDKATAELEVDRAGWTHARRILRHVARASSARAELQRRRSAGESVWTMKRPRKPGGFGARGGGWVLANDGLSLAWDLGRAIALRDS